MPVDVKAYACEFRCGFVRVTRNLVQDHEQKCNKNPSRRGCSTCRHFSIEKDDNGADSSGPNYESWDYPTCEQDCLQEASETNPLGMRFDCEKHEV